MKKAVFLSLLVCSFLAILGIQSFRQVGDDEDKGRQLIASNNQYHLLFPQEKVYLHLDRSSYWLRDTIWFKAYVQNSPVKDFNLHVELVSKHGVVIARKLCWVQNGLSYGDIALPDTLSSGMFEIRAYTNWMRNFDEQYFFRKQLVIWNQNQRKTFDDPRELKRWEADVQFFPEGGTFVAGKSTRMAFKATDQNGMGIKAEGRIVDSRGEEVARFKSLFKGMGSFTFEPKEGEKYKAKVIVNNELSMNVDLPELQQEGVSLGIDANGRDSIHLQVNETKMLPITPGSHPYLLTAQSNGTIFYKKQVFLKDGSAGFTIPKGNFPTGITRFTLFGQNMLPRCERLVFVDHHDQARVQLKPEKSAYRKREKVSLYLSTLDKGDNPLLSNLSVSVFNTGNQLELQKYPENILSRFLLSSELKGYIESPAYYFKDDSLSTLEALDNLLLTQGYRCYEWKAIVNGQYPEIAYEPESGIKIKGSVKTLLSNKPVANTDVNLFFLKSAIGYRQALTDSTGHFEFPGYFFRDTVSVILTAKNPSRKTEKQQNRTYIELDRRSYEFPLYKYYFKRDQYLGYQYDDGQKVSITNSLSQDDLLKINRKWRLSDTIILGEVEVVKKKLTPGERPLRLYDQADYVLDLNTDDSDLTNAFLNLYDKFPNVVVRASKRSVNEVEVNIDYQDAPPILVIDGLVSISGLFEIEPEPQFDPRKPISLMDLVREFSRPKKFLTLPDYFPQGLVDKIEIIKNAQAYGNFEGGAICVFTKRGLYADMPGIKGSRTSTIIGYSVTHQFYSPKYEVKKPFDIKDDFRNTLYWNPVVRTDQDGQALIEFYNSDQPGQVQVVVEGITREGKLCRGVCEYEVTNEGN